MSRIASGGAEAIGSAALHGVAASAQRELAAAVEAVSLAAGGSEDPLPDMPEEGVAASTVLQTPDGNIPGE